MYSSLTEKPWVLPAITGVAGLVVGSLSTLVYVRRSMRKFIETVDFNFIDLDTEDDIVTDDPEADQLQLDYETLVEPYEGVVSSEISDAGRRLVDRMKAGTDSYEFIENVNNKNIVLNPRRDPTEITVESENEDEVIDEPIALDNIFVGADENWDWDAELESRTTIFPYILHQSEYFGDEKGYTQYTLVYYEGDGILADDNDQPIPNIAQCVGKGPLRFGHGSVVENIVHIRNDRFKAEYEIIRDPGRYDVEVLGNDVQDAYVAEDIKHSQHTIHKFRPD